MTNTLSLDVHCPVLDDPTPVDVVDVGGKHVGDLGVDVKPPDVLEEGEELSLDDRIE